MSLSLLWMLCPPAKAEPLTLSAAIEEAKAHNLEFSSSEIDSSRAMLSFVTERAANLEPSLNVSADVSGASLPTNAAVDGTSRLVNRSSGFSTSLSQPLPSGGNASFGWTESFTQTNSANVISASTFSDRATLSVSQPLLARIGEPLRAQHLAALARDEAQLRYRFALEQLTIDTSAGYWRLVSAHLSATLAHTSEGIAQQSLTDVEERFAEGFAGTGDVLQIKRALGTAQLATLVADAEVEAAGEALCRLLGRPISEGPSLEPIDRPELPGEIPSREALLAAAHEGNTQWLLDQLALEQAETSASIARNSGLPALDLVGQVGIAGLEDSARGSRRSLLSANNNDWSLGSQLSIPLPGLALRRAWVDAALAVDAAQIARAAAEQDLLVQVASALRTIERDERRVLLAADTVEVAKAALQADQELLRDGKGSSRNVVISLEALASAQADELSAQIDLQSSTLILRRLAGVLY